MRKTATYAEMCAALGYLRDGTPPEYIRGRDLPDLQLEEAEG